MRGETTTTTVSGLVCVHAVVNDAVCRRRRRSRRQRTTRRRRRRRRPGRRRRNKAHADVVIKRIERRDIVEISRRANENAHFLDKDSCVPLSMHGCVLTNCNCRVCVGTYTPWRYFEISKYLGTRDVVRPTDFRHPGRCWYSIITVLVCSR